MSADETNALADDIAHRLKERLEKDPSLANEIFGQPVTDVELHDEVVAPGVDVHLEDGRRVTIEPDVN
jgi:hypothetical protein